MSNRRVPPEYPQFPRKSRFSTAKSPCLQREAATSSSAVNRRVVGSNPTRGAKFFKYLQLQFARERT
jgi:hypothetical protein